MSGNGGGIVPQQIDSAYRKFGIDREVLFEIAVRLFEPVAARRHARMEQDLRRILDEKLVKLSNLTKLASLFQARPLSLLYMARARSLGLSRRVVGVLNSANYDFIHSQPSMAEDILSLSPHDFRVLQTAIPDFREAGVLNVIALRAILEVTGKFTRSPLGVSEYCKARKEVFEFQEMAAFATDPIIRSLDSFFTRQHDPGKAYQNLKRFLRLSQD